MRITAAIFLAMAIAGCGTGKVIVPSDLTVLKVYRELPIFNGVDLAGWERLTTEFFQHSGAVRVKNGNLLLEKGTDLTGLRWKGKVLEDNYEIAFDARRVDGSDFFCGLTFPVGKEHVTLILGGWGGRVVGLTAVNGFPAVENETTRVIDFEKGRWYSVRVSLADGFIKIYLDRDLIIDLDRKDKKFEVWPQMEVARPLSLTTYGTVGEYRKIRYMRLGKRLNVEDIGKNLPKP